MGESPQTFTITRHMERMKHLHDYYSVVYADLGTPGQLVEALLTDIQLYCDSVGLDYESLRRKAVERVAGIRTRDPDDDPERKYPHVIVLPDKRCELGEATQRDQQFIAAGIAAASGHTFKVFDSEEDRQEYIDEQGLTVVDEE